MIALEKQSSSDILDFHIVSVLTWKKDYSEQLVDRTAMVILYRKNAGQYNKSVNYTFQIAINDISTLIIDRNKKLRLFGKYTTDSLKTSQISQELNLLLMLRTSVLLNEEIVHFHWRCLHCNILDVLKVTHSVLQE